MTGIQLYLFIFIYEYIAPDKIAVFINTQERGLGVKNVAAEVAAWEK
jgi:hypothetical protein